MKKKILSSALCLTIALSMTGCSSSNYDFITLPEYKGIKLESIQQIDVSDADIEARIQSDLASNIIVNDITDRGVKEEDIVNIDLYGTINGATFPNSDVKGYAIKVGLDSLVEGFDDALLGKNIGDKFTVNLNFPKDYYNSDIAGQPVIYEVTINSISTQTTPVLNDELVQSLSETATTVDEYKLEIEKNLLAESSNNNLTSLQLQAWSTIMAGVEVDKFPDSLVNDEVNRIEQQYLNMAQNGGLSLVEYVSTNLGLDQETFKAQNVTMAEYNVTERGVIYKIAELEGLLPTTDEYYGYYQDLLFSYGFNTVEAMLESIDEYDLQTSILSKIVKTFVVEQSVQTDKAE